MDKVGGLHLWVTVDVLMTGVALVETPGAALGVVPSPCKPELVFLGDAVGPGQPVCFWVVLHYQERGTVSLWGEASHK